MPHVVIDARRVRPVPFDRDERESFAFDQLAGDSRAHAVELRGAMRGFADQHDARVTDALQQRREIR